jgi:hypothetical protein
MNFSSDELLIAVYPEFSAAADGPPTKGRGVLRISPGFL